MKTAAEFAHAWTLEVLADVQTATDEALKGRSDLRILEAGCGSASKVRFDASSHIEGIDVSQQALDENPLLQEQILGDLHTADLGQGCYDVVICWDVLEHLNDPSLVVPKLFASTRPGGLIILAVPNLWSIKGLVTRLTPLWFHVLILRHLIGVKTAGAKDIHAGPFKTYLRTSCTPRSLRRLAEETGFAVRYSRTYEGGQQVRLRRRFQAANLAFGLLHKLATVTGLPDITLTDSILLLQKPTSTTRAKESEAPTMHT